MKKPNRSLIMKRAASLRKRGLTRSQALKLAWSEARLKAPDFSLVREGIIYMDGVAWSTRDKQTSVQLRKWFVEAMTIEAGEIPGAMDLFKKKGKEILKAAPVDFLAKHGVKGPGLMARDLNAEAKRNYYYKLL